ncbi:DUF1062 domain-containing protein [Roseibium denhamense]|uniref:DUF1062 domain-containing protein n=1 Tax=Roseibium denhamense TaxID=76305 RepID=A0ABY1NBA7_9HYPH|nr:DUF1062 domain-containing protein [Roseibium denhamense]MTI06595.1 DUF1062 domain-containing protein [Roseibium denhamense]SMP05529.1 hypothetical protein SAMN06265374_0712 [Roseibium denhamense]
MSSLIRVEWTLVSKTRLTVARPCGRCGHLRQFASTNKFRLNANGSRLDAWLIYACQSCGHRWNREVMKRTPVSAVLPDLLSALQANDQGLAQTLAADPACRPSSPHEPSDFELQRRVVPSKGKVAGRAAVLCIRNPGRVPVRLDRVLSTGLRLPRRDIKRLVTQGVLMVTGGSRNAFRKALPPHLELMINTGERGLIDALFAGCSKSSG